MPQISESIELSSLQLTVRHRLEIPEPENNITLPSTYLHEKKVSTANFILDRNKKIPSSLTQFPDGTPQTLGKTADHP